MSAARKSKLRVKQVRSTVGRPYMQGDILRGLGLHGISTTVTVDNTPSFRGMIKKVMHLVSVEEVNA